MAELFDAYRTNYGDVVEDSVAFSGLKHDFFMQAKADLLARRLAPGNMIGDPSKARALDVGCGIGTLHSYVGGMFGELHGCDISAESVERARLEHPGSVFTAYSGTRLPYEDQSFDFAVTVCVVHHVPPQDWPAFFSEMHRVLRPGGVACVIEHNPLNPATRLAVFRCPFDEDAVLLRSGRTEKLYRAAGFNDPETEFFLLLPSEKPLARRIESALGTFPAGAQYATFARR